MVVRVTAMLGQHYLIIPQSRVCPEKLECPQLLKKFPAFCGTGKFITVFTTTIYLFLFPTHNQLGTPVYKMTTRG
jgi:hypothetical protein